MRIKSFSKIKILFIILILLIAAFIAMRLKSDTLKDLSEASLFYREPWFNYKIDSKDMLDDEYSFIYDVLSPQPLPDQARIKEFEFTNAHLHGKESFLRIWLELPDDEEIIKETLDKLSMPLNGRGEFYINDKMYYTGQPEQRVFAETDSGVIIEALRVVHDVNTKGFDTDSLPGSIKVDYYQEIPDAKRNNIYSKRILESDIYKAYRARLNLKGNLNRSNSIIFFGIIIVTGFIIADFLYQREIRNLKSHD